MRKEEEITYAKAGVDSNKEQIALRNILQWTRKTFNFRKEKGSVKIPEGYFANVIDIGGGRGVAISTDGVGTKILVAQLMRKYDTVGIDCVAMNVNDVLCVGAEPLSMVDYIAVSKPDAELLYQIGKGLYEGARIAKINISGGEIAQVKDMIKGIEGAHEFDLVGTAIGLIDLDRIITGQNIEDKDIVVGFASSGIHSNGLALARKVLFEKGKFSVDTYIPELGKMLGHELLEPTLIYVPPVVEMLEKRINIKAMIHITGDGLLNLIRVSSPVSFILDNLPSPQPIFKLIQKIGDISDEEMFTVFNMGIGFCLVIAEQSIDDIQDIASRYNIKVYRIGYVRKDGKSEVIIPGKKLIGKDGKFIRY